MIMESLALFLSCNLLSYRNNTGSEILSLGVSSKDSVKFLIYYFNKYPLLGDKILRDSLQYDCVKGTYY